MRKCKCEKQRSEGKRDANSREDTLIYPVVSIGTKPPLVHVGRPPRHSKAKHWDSSDHHLALGHKRHTGKQRLSAPSHQDKITATVSLGHHGTIFTTELLHQGGGLLFPRTKCRHHSTLSRRVIDMYTCLASAKTSLRLALSRTKPIQVHKVLSQSLSQARYSTKHF